MLVSYVQGVSDKQVWEAVIENTAQAPNIVDTQGDKHFLMYMEPDFMRAHLQSIWPSVMLPLALATFVAKCSQEG